jgi:maltose-binding protein MalE
MRVRAVAPLYTALLAAALLAGCSKKQQSVEIVIWDQRDPSESALLETHLKAYQTSHPNVHVLRSQYETENLRTQFQIAAAAGGGPDLVYGPSDQVGPFSVLRIIQPIDGLVPADTLAHFHPAAFDTLDGHIYALPDQMGNHLALVYNRDLVSEPPQDLDQLGQVAKRLTVDKNDDGRSDQYGLVYNTSEPFWLMPFLGAFGGWVMDAKHAPTLDSPAMAQALAYLVRLKNELGVVPRECDIQLADTMFREGKAAMILNGPWSWDAYRKAGIKIGIARIPRDARTGQWAVPMVGSKGYSINAAVKQEKLPHVLDLLYYLTSPQVTADYAKLLILPARKEALDSPAVAAEPLLAASRAQYEVGRRMPVVPEMRAIWDALRPPMQLVMNGQLDPGTAAAQMQHDALEKIASTQR